MMKQIIAALLFTLPLLGHAELVVVTSNQSTITELTKSEVRQIFSGQSRQIGGNRVQPLDLPSSSNFRETFYRELMGRSPEQMRAYWTRLIFTGQGQPPREVSGAQEMSALLNSSAEFIGYLPASEVGSNMKVLLRIP